MPDIARLVNVFGSAAEVARVAGTARSSVTRWKEGTRTPSPTHQRRLLRAAVALRMPEDEAASALGIPKCPHCGHFHIVR